MSSTATRHCPVCDSTHCEAVGPILHAEPLLVAGVPLELGGTKFTLLRCTDCSFQFKDPVIDPARLLACYAAADSDNWGESPDPWRRKFDVLRDYAERLATGNRILDIGCFNGALLQYLGEKWRCFGVEPSTAAAQLARSRGIDIIADTLESIPAATEKFDVVMAIDVVEHVIDPATFFQQVAQWLRPGGIFMLATGDTDALAWRWQGGAYWYSSLPEHVSFYNRRSLQELGRLNGLDSIAYCRLRPRRISLPRVVSDAAKNVIYSVGRKANGFGIPALQRLFVDRHGPSVLTANDHLVYVYRRKAI